MEGLAKIAENSIRDKEKEKTSNKVFKYLKQNYPEDCVSWSKSVDWELKEVPLKDIQMARRPGGAREQDKVKGIAQAVKDGEAMEPVVLVKLPDGTVKIADGYHRTLGFKHAEQKTINAWIATVAEDKGPWDKEMHERKLNVGKKASEMDLGLAKLAKLEQEDKNVLGLAGAGAGALAIKESLPMIDGMERLYHGTNKEGGKGIREEGLLANRAGEGKATKNANLAGRIGEEPLKGKVYVTQRPTLAADVGMQQAGMNMRDLDIVKLRVPYRHFQDGTVKTVPNPELRGMGVDDWVNAIKKEVVFSPPEAQLRAAYQALSDPITRTIEGDLGTQYIKGAEGYKGQNLAGLVEYIKHNPKRFAGGVGLAGLGATGVGAGLSQVDFGQKKKASELGLAGMEKEASVLGLLGGAAMMHVAPNLGMKLVKSTETGQKGLAGTFAAGVELGRTKRKMHPNIKSFMEYGLGPESTVDYNLGKKLGGRLSDMEPERQERFLGKAKGMFNSHIKNNLSEEAQAEINKVPILNSVKHYFDGHGENKVKNMLVKSSVPEEQATNWKNHVGNVGMLGAAGAVNPELLLQPVLSGVRKKLAKSELGAKVFEKNFTAGHEGKPMSKLKEAAIDMAVSPAVLDSYRIGKSMNKNLSDDVNQAFKENVNVKDAYQTMLAPKA